MADMDTLVEIKDLHTYFYLAEGVVRAVDGVDLTMQRGKTLGVVGESGCGKEHHVAFFAPTGAPAGQNREWGNSVLQTCQHRMAATRRWM